MLSGSFIKTISYVMFGLFVISAYAQIVPPVNLYTARDYNGENQNWGISQGQDQKIYVANNRGLLVYNGAEWQLYPSPNETIMRSVKAIGDRVYTGSYMDFGYWEENKFGVLNYTSLALILDTPLKQDEHFWNIVSLESWVLFQSYNRIYIYDTLNETFDIIDSDATINNLFNSNGSIYFQRFGKGLYKIENGRDVLVSDNNILHENIITNIYYQDAELLIHTQDQGIYSYKNDELVKWNSSINNVLQDVSVYCSLQMQNGNFIVGTISDGVYNFNKNGELIYHINQQSGLNNNTVLSVFEDANNNIWLGLDNGINSIHNNSCVKIYNDYEGKIGTVYTSALYNNNLYLGTNQGLFYKAYNSSEDFKFIEGTQGQVWTLDEIGDVLFCGHNFGTFIVKNGAATKVSNVQGTWAIRSIPNKPELLLQGNYDGLYVLEKKDKWRLRNKIEGFDNSSRFVEIGKHNTVFVNHEYKGVFKIKVDSSFVKVKTLEKDSISQSLHSSIIKYNDQILYAYKEGVFRFNEDNNHFVKDSTLSKVYEDSEYVSGKLVKTKNNLLWLFSERGISYFSPGKLTSTLSQNQIAIPLHLRNTVASYESILHLDNRNYLIGTTSGFITVDIDKIKSNSFDVTINTATSNIRNNPIKLEENTTSTIDYKYNSLEFTFSAPEYSKFFEIQYQTKLEGIYDEWSNWSTIPNKSYENLPAGEYTFYVKARIGDTYSNTVESFSFSIGRPWYISNLMIVFYALIGIISILGIHNLYKLYYRNQQKKLLIQKQKEIDLKELENKQQQMLFNNEKLKQDIDNKNRELAISTMSLIKKNEFLNTLKEELRKPDSVTKLAKVIKIIDNNLNNTDDWKLFEEAFNNADKDFLKKVKDKHPSLTSNDLKLCAYLRLNLSSKEIAPLLNISYRSVEVKRYRLRKKMQLAHESSLTNYILEL